MAITPFHIGVTKTRSRIFAIIKFNFYVLIMWHMSFKFAPQTIRRKVVKTRKFKTYSAKEANKKEVIDYNWVKTLYSI